MRIVVTDFYPKSLQIKQKENFRRSHIASAPTTKLQQAQIYPFSRNWFDMFSTPHLLLWSKDKDILAEKDRIKI